MKKSNFFAAILFLAAMALFRLAFAQTGLNYAIVMDSSGSVIGQLAGSQITVDPNNNLMLNCPVQTRVSAPPGVTMSSQAPAFTATPTTVTVKVSASAPVAFCSSGSSYNKGTGLCEDGKFPYKIVPAGSLSDPKAQNPTVVCRAPMVPTFRAGTWTCIVPTGFKVSLGE